MVMLADSFRAWEHLWRLRISLRLGLPDSEFIIKPYQFILVNRNIEEFIIIADFLLLNW